MAVGAGAPKRGGGRGGGGGGGGRSGPASRSGGKTRKVPGFSKKGKASTGGVNPFDVRSNAKTKYEVLGRRVKGQGRNVAVARADAEAKRKKTLSLQYKQRNKANAFNDKRLGETDPEMSLEDKMMARFQTERKQKMRNSSAFTLQDSDDEQDQDDDLFLTHDGQKIDDYDRLNHGDASAFGDDDGDDDAETHKMNQEIVNRLHFGGGGGASAGAGGEEGVDADGRKKTHKEIMQEVMMKSKMFKAERQKSKANQEDVTETLDSEFDSLRSLLSFRPTKGSKEAVALAKEEKKQMPLDEFDKITRELTFEAKAQASERRMSPEEQAKRDFDKLQELEKKRIARMKGEEEDDEEGEGGKRGGKNKNKNKNKTKTPQLIIMRPPATDDDLGADYEVDQRFGGAMGGEDGEEEEEEAEMMEEEDDEEDADSDAGSGSDEGEEAEEEDEEEAEEEEEEDALASEDDDEEEEEETQEDQEAAQKKADKKRKRQEAAEELPFVFDCPESLEELLQLFKRHATGASDKRALIVDRIIKLYNPKLHVDNQLKMKRFFAILVRLFLKYAKQYAVYKQDLDSLAKSLFTIAQELSETAGIVARELLINLRKRLHSTKALSKAPQLSELLLFKCFIQIFPTSDLRHNVLSPLETLLSESLMRMSLDTPSESTNALFMCTLLLQMTKDKQRFTPEVVVVLKKVLRAFVVDAASDDTHRSVHWLRQDLLAWVAGAAQEQRQEELQLELPALSLASASSASGAQVLHATLSLLDVLAIQYAPLPSFDELVYPHYLLLHELTKSFSADAVPSQLHSTISLIHERLTGCWQTRLPLRLQTFGPTVLPAFTPKFEANYSLRKDKTMDREKAKTKQLERQVKRARKNAARELRRDASFLAREKQQEDQKRVDDKKEKQKEIWKWLEDQNATFNEQAKKGGNMLKGGGSGPARKRRVTKKTQ